MQIRKIEYLLLVFCLVTLGTDRSVQAQTADVDSSSFDVLVPPATMPAADQPDTIRTNLWLAEALMGEIVVEAVRGMPAAPGSVLLEGRADTESNELFENVAANRLLDLGYEVFLANGDSSGTIPAELHFQFDVVKVQLDYPEVGRTLGIWQNWVGRDLQVVANVEITEFDSGRLVTSDRYTRNFSDRVDNEHFSAVQSDMYSFTSAQTKASGWNRRVEEIVILGSLVGLIAVYFANTGN